VTSEAKRQLIARGRTAEVYAWQDHQVLKLFYDWCPAPWIKHEVDIGRILVNVAIPTPKMLGTASLDGRQGILYERVDGPDMLSLLASRPWTLSRFARQFADLHSEIHQHSGSGFSALRASLAGAIRASKILTQAEIEAVLSSLEQLPDGTALCHFDFHPGQVIVTAGGPVIIDWMTALQGEPAADVARTSILLTFGEVPGAGWLMRNITNLIKKEFKRAYLARYLEVRPDVSRQQVESWLLPVAAARLNEDIPGEQGPLLKFIRRTLQKP
jgi:aminoglycoside phosphotransferase (APT) family kinase protein